MDLKKSRKKLKQKNKGATPAAAAGEQMHVYRSEDKNAPFESWERITKTPIPEGDFVDADAKRRHKFFYYKLTFLRPDGSETPPVDNNTVIENGVRRQRTPENSVMGSYLYWTTDPDLPLDEWTKIDELVTDADTSFQSPVKQDFYVYSVSVNFLGKELQRTGVQKVIYKGPK